MNCPKCSAEIAVADLTTPTRGALARAVLTDWRVWALAVAVMLVSGVIAGALELPNAGAGGGAVIGILVALRMGRLRACPKCGGVVTLPKDAAQA